VSSTSTDCPRRDNSRQVRRSMNAAYLRLAFPPGTGKTTVVRALADAWRPWCRFEYVLDPEQLFSVPWYLVQTALGLDGDRAGRGGWRLVVLEDCDEHPRRHPSGPLSGPGSHGLMTRGGTRLAPTIGADGRRRGHPGELFVLAGEVQTIKDEPSPPKVGQTCDRSRRRDSRWSDLDGGAPRATRCAAQACDPLDPGRGTPSAVQVHESVTLTTRL
jgi:hypothetical protein